MANLVWGERLEEQVQICLGVGLSIKLGCNYVRSRSSVSQNTRPTDCDRVLVGTDEGIVEIVQSADTVERNELVTVVSVHRRARL